MSHPRHSPGVASIPGAICRAGPGLPGGLLFGGAALAAVPAGGHRLAEERGGTEGREGQEDPVLWH